MWFRTTQSGFLKTHWLQDTCCPSGAHPTQHGALQHPQGPATFPAASDTSFRIVLVFTQRPPGAGLVRSCCAQLQSWASALGADEVCGLSFTCWSRPPEEQGEPWCLEPPLPQHNGACVCTVPVCEGWHAGLWCPAPFVLCLPPPCTTWPRPVTLHVSVRHEAHVHLCTLVWRQKCTCDHTSVGLVFLHTWVSTSDALAPSGWHPACQPW